MSGSVWKVIPDWVWQAQKDTANRRAKVLCDIGDAVCKSREVGKPDPTDTGCFESKEVPIRRVHTDDDIRRHEAQKERDAWEWMANH